MASGLRCKLAQLAIVVLVVGLLALDLVQARPLKTVQQHQHSESIEKIIDQVTNLVLNGIKTSGPSPGIGHKMSTATLDAAESGPSPGVGH